MPELPEVETIKRQLEKEVVGARIKRVEVPTSPMASKGQGNKCWIGDKQLVVGEKIVEVARMGKYLFIKFGSGRGLMIHLKMTGRLVLNDLDYDTAPHTRAVIFLEDGRKIYYWDTRKFGYIRVEDDIESVMNNLREKMGPEPWEISDVELLRKLQKTSRSIKETILDQNILAGVGNIYGNDGLWLAGINPKRIANSLWFAEVTKLRNSLCNVLERGLATGGASDNTYRDFYGKSGSYQNEFLVYGRTNEPCRKCGRLLVRVVVRGRGTWVCEKCQK